MIIFKKRPTTFLFCPIKTETWSDKCPSKNEKIICSPVDANFILKVVVMAPSGSQDAPDNLQAQKA